MPQQRGFFFSQPSVKISKVKNKFKDRGGLLNFWLLLATPYYKSPYWVFVSGVQTLNGWFITHYNVVLSSLKCLFMYLSTNISPPVGTYTWRLVYKKITNDKIVKQL